MRDVLIIILYYSRIPKRDSESGVADCYPRLESCAVRRAFALYQDDTVVCTAPVCTAPIRIGGRLYVGDRVSRTAAPETLLSDPSKRLWASDSWVFRAFRIE